MKIYYVEDEKDLSEIIRKVVESSCGLLRMSPITVRFSSIFISNSSYPPLFQEIVLRKFSYRLCYLLLILERDL